MRRTKKKRIMRTDEVEKDYDEDEKMRMVWVGRCRQGLIIRTMRKKMMRTMRNRRRRWRRMRMKRIRMKGSGEE